MRSRSVQEERHRFRMLLAASAAVHLLVFMALIFAPASSARLQPTIVTVDLVSASSLAEVRPALKSKVKAKAKPKAKPKAPPKPRAKKVVIPKEAPKATRKPRPAQPEELDYDDALAQLREELGESSEPPTEIARAAEPTSASAIGERIDPEVAAWMLATRRHVRSVWVTPPEFLERPLRTVLAVQVTTDGRILGAPDVVRRSGDPFWDDTAVRAILRASPLPPPPMAGEWQLSFTPRATP